MSMLRAITGATVALICCCMTGCATIVKGHSQQIAVSTNPPGAACDLSRDGKTIGVVNPTPGSVSVGKSRADISVSCNKDRYEPATGKVTSSFHPMTFGNILFGGLIGIGVDAASGAMNEYEPSLTMTLIPVEFESGAERDAFFDKMRSDVTAQAEQTFAQLSKRCSGTADCDRKRAAAEKSKDTALAGVEDKRTMAKVKSALANVPSAAEAGNKQ